MEVAKEGLEREEPAQWRRRKRDREAGRERMIRGDTHVKKPTFKKRERPAIERWWNWSSNQ